MGVDEQLIFNGIQFEDLYRSNRVHFRYFETPDYQKGDIHYQGQDYYNINLRYDLVDDQVIVTSTGSLNFLDIQLIQEKVENFKIRDRHFIFQGDNKTLEKGFYEVAYEDEDVVFLVKHSKSPNKKIGNGRMYFTFKEKESFFLKRGDAISKISNLREVKKFFRENSESIENFLDNNPQGSTENFRSYMTRLLEYLQRNIKDNNL